MSEQMIKKVLITGANGFIGGSLMRYYQNQGQDVVGVDLVGNGNDIIDGGAGDDEILGYDGDQIAELAVAEVLE